MLAASDGKPEAQSALALLFREYWLPLFGHLRARGHDRHEAEDLVQAFFAHMFEKQTIGRADRFKGSFRGFLLGSLRYFLANQREFAAAYKRGGKINFVSFDTEGMENFAQADASLDPAADVERDFDRRWARLIMERALAKLQDQYAGEPARFLALKGFLTASETARYEAVAADLGVTVAVVKTAVHRMRRQFRDVLRSEIAATVSAPHEIDAELRHLIHAVSSE